MEITIARRYRGPLDSANGGYAAGLLAAALGGPAEVTLRLPPPLESPLSVETTDGGGRVLLDAGRIVAEARSGEPAVSVPPVPTSEELRAAAGAGAVGWGSPAFAECFVCGTRADGSGLEIHPCPVPGRELVVARWAAREVTPVMVWAAIDCAGAYAVGGPGRGEPVLARMTARVDALPVEGEPCLVLGWPLGVDGRKLHAGTALVGGDGQILAVSRQLWIEPRRAADAGAAGVSATSSPPSSS